MRRNDIQPDLRDLAFDFFYWFSRFELRGDNYDGRLSGNYDGR
ncbi:hypothetical protein [Sphingopyxis alaskensis]|nr:hypothetical protein [Sphingopyxis alaskensis]